ncbi:double-strand break repair protein AddB [Erythrobacter insulae]|uniref:Double-strand break repair protein AddB n=1 Tax=Erythrobacter insulae TaxID=2584124 RepID=A0A547P7D4_9SPHN|nr:double-strand break repair protein AddB [Erythrobacter insulae]TRD10028.1 double-strand break repair protein AddB [Erythrobacter insulae]
MGETSGPEIYSIAAHRGFADALVAGLIPRYSQTDAGLARLTLLVPSSRAARTLSEAFVRHSGEAGLLMPRMVTVGDLDLDEALGNLLDPLGASDIPPAVEPTQRWLEIAQLIEAEQAEEGLAPLPGLARLRLARDIARAMDRLLVEDVSPDALTGEAVLDQLGNLSGHWKKSLRRFARVEARWRERLAELGRVDAATRRNMLFDRAALKWRTDPPSQPIVAAGVTSASPALARMLRVIADLPNGAVILPDLDLSMNEDAWDELGRAGAAPEPGGEVFGKKDALTHPQYHLKLLLQRMGIARAEVRPWHRKGEAAAPPARSHAISSLFLPPQASQSWIDLEPDKRRLSGVRLMTTATSAEEAQAIAMLVREALEQPTRRIAVITADRALALRVTQQLERWNIVADDTAGRPLSLTPAGRMIGLLAGLASGGLEPAALIAALAHPLVQRDIEGARSQWLSALRAFEYDLRGPSPAPGYEPLRAVADKAKVRDWWDGVERVLTPLLAPLFADEPEIALADAIDTLTIAAEALAGDAVWAREDGRALSAMIEDLRLHARGRDTAIAPADLAGVLRDCMDEVSVRPPYGGHPRVSIYGLLESRMARADLIICGGLNEGSWPQAPGADPMLAPAILRALGVPGAEFRIGLSAHDLAGAMGAPEVVLSRAQRDSEGPTLASRFWLRVEALLGEKLAAEHRESTIPLIMPLLDRDPVPASEPEPYPRPEPKPSSEQRQVKISATALDRLLGDPYQFYAREILGLKRLDPLAADPFADPALRGTLVHDILDAWHKARIDHPNLALVPFAEKMLTEKQVHPLFWGLWRPRICAALERFEEWVNEDAKQGREVIATEVWGEMMFEGVRVGGKPDRIDRLADGTLAIVDYKTGKPPSKQEVSKGYRLQLGVLGLIASEGVFDKDGAAISGDATKFEFWSLRKVAGEFGERNEPVKLSDRQSGLLPEDFLHEHERYLREAITKYIKGDAPFIAKENPDYPGFTDYDQLMRLDEWQLAQASDDAGPDA